MIQKDKIKILLVEDHPLYRVGLHMALSYSGLACVLKSEAENVAQALDFLQHHSDEVDLILLDYFLPDGTGMDVLKVAKQRFPRIKVLLVSGEDNNPELDAMIHEGLNGFVSKDVTPQGLATVITSVFAGKDYFGHDSEELSSEGVQKNAEKRKPHATRTRHHPSLRLGQDLKGNRRRALYQCSYGGIT